MDNTMGMNKNRLGYTMFKKLNGWMGLAALGLTSNLAWGATLTDVGFAALPGDRTQVTLTFDEAPPQPAGYTIDKPARIALDLNGVANGLSSKYHNLGMGNAQSMTVVESQGRTRVVFNLAQMVPYSTSIAGNQMIVVVGDGAGSEVASAAPAVSGVVRVAAMAAPVGVPSVAGVDFRRGPKGEGQVLINFSSSTVNVELVEQAGRILMRVPEAALPNELRRRLDVTDFATPVKRVDTYTEGDVVVIDVRPEGNYDYLAYQADNSFTLSVEPLSQDEVDKRRKEKFPYSGEKLSLNFQDIEVRSVLQLIADFTGLNLVASDTVGGRITLRLQNVPWDQALDLILKTKALDKRQIGNVLLVAPATEIAEREKQELETSKQVAELAPVRLDIVQVNYAKAADIVGLLKQDKDLISERGFISSDARTNTISVRETTDKLEQIRSLVSTWDVPVRQVLIEARIVLASTDVSKDIGVSWGGGAYRREGGNLWTAGGSIGTLGEVKQAALDGGGTISFPDALVVDMGVTKANTSSLAIGFGSDNFLIDLELSALEKDGKAQVVSQPKVITADRQKAKIKSGEEIPYQEASSSGATSVSFKEAALSLEVTPQITPDDKIIMDLVVNKDSRGEVTAGVPSIRTNGVETQVLVGNGETVVLGGIFESQSVNTITKTPFLGDIPYLGRLFTKNEALDTRSELLIFVTPKIIKSSLID